MRLQVYWIVFSGLLVFEQFGLLPIFIGNVLYAGARFRLSEMVEWRGGIRRLTQRYGSFS